MDSQELSLVLMELIARLRKWAQWPPVRNLQEFGGLLLPSVCAPRDQLANDGAQRERKIKCRPTKGTRFGALSLPLSLPALCSLELGAYLSICARGDKDIVNIGKGQAGDPLLVPSERRLNLRHSSWDYKKFITTLTTLHAKSPLKKERGRS